MDGQLRSHKVRSDEATGTVESTRELHDVAARVADMDRMSVDTQVVYPTVLLNELTRRVDLDIALCHSYNRWLAARSAESDGRIRWVAMPPLSSMPDALEEMRFAKEQGAVGIFKRGIEWDRPIHDPYFHPLYALADELDLPICIHATLPWTAIDAHFSRLDNPYPQGTNAITAMQAFHALVTNKIPSLFPAVRFGFVEAGASWLPSFFEMTRTKKTREQLAEWRFFVTCEPDEDLSYLINLFGDEHFIVGTDYTHSDRSSVLNKHQSICDRSDVDDTSAVRITSTNAYSFYGILQ